MMLHHSTIELLTTQFETHNQHRDIQLDYYSEKKEQWET